MPGIITLLFRFSFLCALSEHPSLSLSLNGDDVFEDLLVKTAATNSSVTLEWRFVGCPNYDNLAFQYRMREPIVKPEFLEWDTRCHHFKIHPAETITESGRFADFSISKILFPVDMIAGNALVQVSDATYLRADQKTSSVVIDVQNLKFSGTDYLFELIRVTPWHDYYGSHQDWADLDRGNVIAEVVANTAVGTPRTPPKTGQGCFRVVDVNATHRVVNIYWRKETGNYRVAVLKGFQQEAVHFHENHLHEGFMTDTLDLGEHNFVLQSASFASYSGVRSVVRVPSQDKLLPRASKFVFTRSKGKCDAYELTWKKPDNLNITSYTVAWVTSYQPGKVDIVHDWVYLNGSANSFRISTKRPYFQLAISVNTEYSSSGLYVAARFSNGLLTAG